MNSNYNENLYRPQTEPQYNQCVSNSNGLPPGQQNQYHYYSYKKFYRSRTDKWLGGVCGGLAKYYQWDPTLVRILWVVVSLFSMGAGIIGYILFWIFVKKEPSTYVLTKQRVTRDGDGTVHYHHHYRPAD